MWEHRVIDDFLDEDLYQSVLELDDIESIRQQLHDRLDDKIYEILKNDRIYAGRYFKANSIRYRLNHWTAGSSYPFHPDCDSKMMSIVIYIGDDNIGLIKSIDEHGSEVEEVEWKANRAIVFFPERNTWHKVETYKDKDRRTLCVFVAK